LNGTDDGSDCEELDVKLQDTVQIDDEDDGGTPLTLELFIAWKKSFELEMDKIEDEKRQRENAQKKGTITGRMMFERDRTLAESDLNNGDPGKYVFSSRIFL
jgi:hypothetical protein